MAPTPEMLLARRQYKMLLRELIEGRPSGTRQSIARRIGRSRSFISQILNPDSKVPLPEQYVPVVMKVCEFSEGDVVEFMEYYEAAHPKKNTELMHSGIDTMIISLPRFASQEQRKAVEEAILETADRIIAASLTVKRRKSRTSMK